MLCCFVCVELLMLLRYVYHEILGNQDVADLPHFRKFFFLEKYSFFLHRSDHSLRKNGFIFYRKYIPFFTEKYFVRSKGYHLYGKLVLLFYVERLYFNFV